MFCSIQFRFSSSFLFFFELSKRVLFRSSQQVPNTQQPNTHFLDSIKPSSENSLISPKNGFIRVKPTMQFADPAYPHLYAVGDVADSGGKPLLFVNETNSDLSLRVLENLLMRNISTQSRPASWSTSNRCREEHRGHD